MENLNKYITELDNTDKNEILKRINIFGYEETFNNQIKYLDCTRINSDGLRLMQTIGYPYMREISITLFIINLNDNEEEKAKLLDILNKRHEDNLEYEKTNPPVWYDKKLKGKILKPKTKKEKSTEPKVSAAQRKLAAKIAKINTLGLKLKPAT